MRGQWLGWLLAMAAMGGAQAATPEILAQVQGWRRDFHQHPELGNRETRTAGIVAAHLKSLGLEVREGVAHTGVVGLLKGGLPGPVVALRAYFGRPRAALTRAGGRLLPTAVRASAPLAASSVQAES